MNRQRLSSFSVENKTFHIYIYLTNIYHNICYKNNTNYSQLIITFIPLSLT
jgi:hypothetical protein